MRRSDGSVQNRFLFLNYIESPMVADKLSANYYSHHYVNEPEVISHIDVIIIIEKFSCVLFPVILILHFFKKIKLCYPTIISLKLGLVYTILLCQEGCEVNEMQ